MRLLSAFVSTSLLPLTVGSVAALATGACGGEPPPQAPAAAPAAPPAPAPVATGPAPTATAAAPATAPSDAASPAPRAGAASPLPGGSASNEASLALHRALKGEPGNLFFSGTSMRTALGMTALGAKGATLDEMVKALALPADAAQIASAGKAEAAAWKAAAGKAELVIANRLWLDKGASLEKPFVAQAKDGFGASPELVDFARAADPSREKINAWVSDTTKGKIKDLLPKGSLTNLTRLVLTNAIYFKGNWATAFEKGKTKDEPFHAAAGDVTVPMMHRSGEMGYASNDEVQLVELDYKDSELAMLVALPQPSAKLADIEGELTGGKVEAWAKSLGRVKVDLSMPRFTFSWGRSVKPELAALGMKTAFGPTADFTGVSMNPRDLYVSDVFHKAFVLVDETGTEAAAATGVVMATRAAMRNPVVRLDRPFVFFIRSKKSGDVLFQGRVANPKG